MNFALAAIIAWGAFAFGSVYAWAYLPLAFGAVIIGAAALITRRRHISLGAPALATAILAAAIGLQLVPLSTPRIRQFSEGAHKVLSASDIGYAAGVATHPLSVNVAGTLFGLIGIGVLAVWAASTGLLFGNAKRLHATVRNLIVVAAALAIIGLAQHATFNGKVLWFWTPQVYAWNSFGPFVNRNHFAGWMLLALAITVGYFIGTVGRVKPPKSETWHDRLLWLGSPEALPVVLIAAAIVLMAVSLVWTMSRSGIVAAGVALTILLAAAARRSRADARRGILVGYLFMTVVGVVAWRGGDTLVNWYGNTTTLEWRIQLWKDTLPALKDFWLTGSGFNTYGTVTLVYPRADMTVHPVEAHNDYLQLAVEGGLLVGVPVLLLALAIGREIVRRLKQPQDDMTWWIRMGAVAGICGMAVQEMTEFSLQIPGVALLFATCVAIAMHEPAPVTDRVSRRVRRHRELVTAI